MCRSRRELSNAYLLAKIGVDTAENEPLEVWGENSIQYSLHSLLICDFFRKHKNFLTEEISYRYYEISKKKNASVSRLGADSGRATCLKTSTATGRARASEPPAPWPSAGPMRQRPSGARLRTSVLGVSGVKRRGGGFSAMFSRIFCRSFSL